MRWIFILSFFLSISKSTTFLFTFVVPCIKTFHHGTSMQCLHQATLKSTYNRFKQGPFIKSVFSAHKGKKSTCGKFKREKGLLCQAVSKELCRRKWKKRSTELVKPDWAMRYPGFLIGAGVVWSYWALSATLLSQSARKRLLRGGFNTLHCTTFWTSLKTWPGVFTLSRVPLPESPHNRTRQLRCFAVH